MPDAFGPISRRFYDVPFDATSLWMSLNTEKRSDFCAATTHGARYKETELIRSVSES